MNLSKSIEQCWADIIAGSKQIPNQEKQILEAYFYIGAMTTIGILNRENDAFSEELATLERSIKETSEQLHKPADIVQYH